MHTGRKPCVDQGRDQNDASASQEALEIACKWPGFRTEAWNRFSLTPLRRSQPYWHFELRFIASIIVRHISIV